MPETFKLDDLHYHRYYLKNLELTFGKLKINGKPKPYLSYQLPQPANDMEPEPFIILNEDTRHYEVFIVQRRLTSAGLTDYQELLKALTYFCDKINKIVDYYTVTLKD